MLAARKSRGLPPEVAGQGRAAAAAAPRRHAHPASSSPTFPHTASHSSNSSPAMDGGSAPPEEDFSKLPLEDRLAHKVCPARLHVYAKTRPTRP